MMKFSALILNMYTFLYDKKADKLTRIELCHSLGFLLWD